MSCLALFLLPFLLSFATATSSIQPNSRASSGPSLGDPWPEEVGWAPEHYSLDVAIDYDSEKLSGRAEITLRNQTERALATVPVLLYRLMKVTSATGPSGQDLPFVQQVETYQDYDRLQVNFIEIRLPEPIPAGGSFTLALDYGGYLLGRREAYGYVRETIDPGFTILRDDSDAYPTLGYPSRRSTRSRPLTRWSYEARITVPDSLVVANGGELVDRTAHDGVATYHFVSRVPSWRMDFAVAPYEFSASGPNSVFALPEDASRLEDILSAMDQTLELYTKWFGQLQDFHGVTVIEIPEGFGSQTDATAIIQQAEAFKDPENLHELYHELSHKWNVKATDQHPSRIEEGLAVFLESLTVEKLEGRDYLDGYMDLLLNYVRRLYREDPDRATVSMAAFGEHGLEGMSYSVGAVFFRLLYDRVGQGSFNEVFRALYAERFESGATVDEVMRYVREGAGTDVEKLLNDWVYGTRYCELIQEGLGIEDLLALYSGAAL